MIYKILSLRATRPASISNNEWFEYQAGHSNARHAAAKLALKADATIASLLAALKLAQTIIGHPDDDGSKIIAAAIKAAEGA